jgi:hypothetical protein
MLAQKEAVSQAVQVAVAVKEIQQILMPLQDLQQDKVMLAVVFQVEQHTQWQVAVALVRRVQIQLLTVQELLVVLVLILTQLGLRQLEQA